MDRVMVAPITSGGTTIKLDGADSKHGVVRARSKMRCWECFGGRRRF